MSSQVPAWTVHRSGKGGKSGGNECKSGMIVIQAQGGKDKSPRGASNVIVTLCVESDIFLHHALLAPQASGSGDITAPSLSVK